MKLIEIAQKWFNVDQGAITLLEAYTNPSAELSVKCSPMDPSDLPGFYKAVVKDNSTGTSILAVTFELSKSNPNVISVGNIAPTHDVVPDKVTHTTAGSQFSGLDVGHTAIKWLYSEIKKYAASEGFDIKKLVSTNRYTGARAKNNPSTNIQNFNVGVNVKE